VQQRTQRALRSGVPCARSPLIDHAAQMGVVDIGWVNESRASGTPSRLSDEKRATRPPPSLAVTSMASHLRGQQVEHRIATGETLATPENMDQPEIKKLLEPESAEE